MSSPPIRMLVLAALLCAGRLAPAQEVPARTLDQVSQAMVKIYGAGGLSGLEAYQTGILVSPEGRVVTVDSLVLEPGDVIVVTGSGDRYLGQVVGADPLLRVAVVQIDPAGETLPAVDLSTSANASRGEPLLAFSNLFNIASGDEPVSVMRTTLSTRASRRSALGPDTPLGTDQLLLIDAVTSNPGAAGGLITNYRGAPLGMIGPERRGVVTGGWLNYALPSSQVAASVARIVRGEQIAREGHKTAKPVNLLDKWGFSLVETVARRTPPFVEHVQPDSPASKAGLRADDLVVMVTGLVSGSTREVQRLLTIHADEASVRITVERNGELIDAELPSTAAAHGEGSG